MKSKPQTAKTKSVMVTSAAGSKGILPSDYPYLLKDIKARIRAGVPGFVANCAAGCGTITCRKSVATCGTNRAPGEFANGVDKSAGTGFNPNYAAACCTIALVS